MDGPTSHESHLDELIIVAGERRLSTIIVYLPLVSGRYNMTPIVMKATREAKNTNVPHRSKAEGSIIKGTIFPTKKLVVQLAVVVNVMPIIMAGELRNG